MSEQCYTHLSRREIRYDLLTRLGLDPAGDSADQIAQQMNQYIRAASLRANEQVQWAHAQRQVKIESGAELGEIPFPPGCGPGSILQISVWIDEETRNGNADRFGPYPANVFVPLSHVLLRNDFDSDPLWDAGGEDIKRVLGIPQVWGTRDKILIRPLTDQNYLLKILYTMIPELKCDEDITTMDAELIVIYAMVEYYNYSEEFGAADRMLARAENRLRFLRAQQSSDQIRNLQHGVDLRLSPDQEGLLVDPRDIPTFDFRALGQTWDAAGTVTNPNTTT